MEERGEKKEIVPSRVVKPLVELLHPDVDGKANYDALVTLTNLV